jgi:hypothetical protein
MAIEQEKERKKIFLGKRRRKRRIDGCSDTKCKGKKCSARILGDNPGKR